MEAYEAGRAAGDCVKIYSLSTNSQETKMDISSYRIILRGMVAEYREKSSHSIDREDRVDRYYLPILPAPPKNNIVDDKIHGITFKNPPLDENAYCDERFGRFIVSPYPVGLLIECMEQVDSDALYYWNMKMEQEVLETKDRLDEAEKRLADIDVKKYNACQKQAIEYMTKIYGETDVGKLMSDEDKEMHVKEVWRRFSKFVRKYLV